jgi:hypothetical protein
LAGEPTFIIVIHIFQLLNRDVQHAHILQNISYTRTQETTEGKENTQLWNQTNVTSLVVARRSLSFLPMSNLYTCVTMDSNKSELYVIFIS